MFRTAFFGSDDLQGWRGGEGTGRSALVAIRKVGKGASGRPLALAGIAISGGWVFAVGGFIAYADSFGTDFLYDRVGSVSQAGATTIGACLRDPHGIGSVWHQTDCRTAHDVEVYEVFELADGAYPGKDAINIFVDEECLGSFKGYVGGNYFPLGVRLRLLRPRR